MYTSSWDCQCYIVSAATRIQARSTVKATCFRRSYHSPPNAEVKNAMTYTSTSPCGLVAGRGKMYL